MGALRVILALAVVAAHVGPLAGLRFFGGGVMAVESFYILSGFYMALVLSTRYRTRMGDFYFNRFLRLFPVYWLLAVFAFAVGALYWLLAGHPLGVLAQWHQPIGLWQGAWAVLSNVFMIGSDWALLAGHLAAQDSPAALVGRLLAIAPVWSLAIELTFYLAAPFILRCSLSTQLALAVAALTLRLGIVAVAGGDGWTVWSYYFAPATWVFFMAGVLSYHLLERLRGQAWFRRSARPAGRLLLVGLLAWIATFEQSGLLGFQSAVYYLAVALSLPFLFETFGNSRADAALAAWSYPIYLAHWVVFQAYAPLRHFIPEAGKPYVVLALTAVLCGAVLSVDKSIRKRFKRL